MLNFYKKFRTVFSKSFILVFKVIFRCSNFSHVFSNDYLAYDRCFGSRRTGQILLVKSFRFDRNNKNWPNDVKSTDMTCGFKY
jgi:hypothetical protein